MNNVPKVAYPVREGVLVRNGKEEIAWQEHLWNTGERTLSWFIEPDSLALQDVTERNVALRPPDQ